MPAVLIYSQKNLEYIVLSNRRIFSKDKDLVRPIANADKHVFWTDLEHRKHVHRLIKLPKHGAGAEHRNRNAQRHPK